MAGSICSDVKPSQQSYPRDQECLRNNQGDTKLAWWCSQLPSATRISLCSRQALLTLPGCLCHRLQLACLWFLFQELTKPRVSGDAGRLHQGALGRSPGGGSKRVQLPIPSGAEPSQDCSPQIAPGPGWWDPTGVDLLHHHVRTSPLPLPGWKRGSGQPALPLLPLCLDSCHRKDLITETTGVGEKDKPPVLCQPPTISGGAGSHPWSPAQPAAPTVAAAGITGSRPCVLIGWERHRYSQAPS